MGGGSFYLLLYALCFVLVFGLFALGAVLVYTGRRKRRAGGRAVAIVKSDR